MFLPYVILAHSESRFAPVYVTLTHCVVVAGQPVFPLLLIRFWFVVILVRFCQAGFIGKGHRAARQEGHGFLEDTAIPVLPKAKNI